MASLVREVLEQPLDPSVHFLSFLGGVSLMTF